jgi:hypothetical protein
MLIIWHGQHDRIQISLSNHLLVIRENLWNAVFGGHFLGARGCARKWC